jgi:hypothetical protein
MRILKIEYPPKVDLFGFELADVRPICRDKLVELSGEKSRAESDAAIKEDFCYQCLNSVPKYGVSYFQIMIYLYLLEKQRDEIERWRRYWVRLGRIETQKLPKGGITEAELQTARDFPIQELIDTPVRQAGGAKLRVLCPFHEEKKPSFVIYTNDNSWHCFGCGVHGRGAISFLMERDNLGFKEAIERLR